MRVIVFARVLFALGSAGLALLCLAYGDFAPMWKSLPADLPGRDILISAVAIPVLAASAGLFIPRLALPSLFITGAYYLVWAVIAAPQILSKPLSIGAWYGDCEALTSLAGAWILYSGRSVRVAQILFGLTCVFYGWSHFAYAAYTAAMVPSWLPGPLPFAYITGAGHIAAGIGLIVGVLPRLAATLEAIMMSLFGLLVWVPSFFADPTPAWATPPQNQWSELVVNVALAAAAWIVAASLSGRTWLPVRRV